MAKRFGLLIINLGLFVIGIFGLITSVLSLLNDDFSTLPFWSQAQVIIFVIVWSLFIIVSFFVVFGIVKRIIKDYMIKKNKTIKLP